MEAQAHHYSLARSGFLTLMDNPNWGAYSLMHKCPSIFEKIEKEEDETKIGWGF
ncbi:hypothetical protein SLEP1_g42301 [Rubroshorea leprosula]|uniref:Uncharacterized protein n=1 Tax=Rubroshorea leprosula TaxID=152421 RepID=A0AAV5LA96_9ROSI|nr:hypothetical protein SLEP1_g42301 [Rubroshorea leprosula]